jgi:hypothetical protein
VHFLFQDACNQMQQAGTLACSRGRAALRAISADFETRDHDVKPAFALDLSLEPVEKIALKFQNLAAAQACHVDMVTLGPSFVEVFFSLHVHQVKLVYKPMPLEQAESSIHGDAIDVGIEPAGTTQDLAGVEVLGGGFDHAQNLAPLPGHADAAGHEFCLQASWRFGLRKWHG